MRFYGLVTAGGLPWPWHLTGGRRRTMKALSYRHGLRETAQIGVSVIFRQ
jgi:hypothetical protein